MKNKYLLPAVMLLSVLLLTGCYNVDGEFKSIRNTALKEYGKNFVTDMEFALGSFELWLAEGIVSIAEPDEIAADIIDCVSEVQVGTYLRKGNYEIPTKDLLKKIDRQMERKGWKFMVKAFQKDEMTAVYINKNAAKMFRDLFIVQIDDEQMTIVQVKGDLRRVIETAIRGKGIYMNKHNRRELAGR
ncbi:MAG: DUF4252 domain-containing protein [Ignavibacteriaceae bacterium]